MTPLKSYLHAQWIGGTGEGTPCWNPTTGDVIATCATGGLDLGGALAFARNTGGPALRAMTFVERAALLDRLVRSLHAHRDELLDLCTLNVGATRTDGKFDVDGAAFAMSAYVRLGTELGDLRITVEDEIVPLDRGGRFVGRHVRRPREGVAIHLNAFNFPAWGMCEKLGPAILAGVPVLTKPAPATAVVAHRLFEIWVAEAGLVPGALSLLCGDPSDLLDHVGPQDVVAFTGSASTGNRIRSHARILEQTVRVNVEADSLNAAILGPDVEEGDDLWSTFVRDTIREMTQKAGQKCTATRRIVVPVRKLGALRDAIGADLGSVVVGDPALKETRVGPLATAHQVERARQTLTELRRVARVVAGDPDRASFHGVEPGRGYFFPPVLLEADHPFAADAIHTRELFGPVATLLPYDGEATSALEIVRLGRGSLVTSVYSGDRAFVGDCLAMAPWVGRLLIVTPKIAELTHGPGAVLPDLIHGGPGRAGGGEELGGRRGLALYEHRTALQGESALLDRLLRAT